MSEKGLDLCSFRYLKWKNHYKFVKNIKKSVELLYVFHIHYMCDLQNINVITIIITL